MRPKRSLGIILAGVLFFAVLALGGSLSRETLICYDSEGEVVEQDQIYVWPWGKSAQSSLEKHCNNRGYSSAELVHVDLYGLHRVTYFYGWQAARRHGAGR